MLTRNQLKTLFPRAGQAHIDAFLAQHPVLFAQFGIAGGRNRLHFFLAQISHESAGLTVTEENLSYSAARMMAVWPSRFRSLQAAEPYARQPEKLANNVYASRMGNGPPDSGDGWRFRGRGYAQLTGRDAYAEVGAVAMLDLLMDPDAVAHPDTALRVACAFWMWKGLSPSADRGDFIGNTRRWNGGTIGMEDRQRCLARVQQVVPWTAGATAHEAPVLDRDTVIRVQRVLKAHGLYDASIDGIIGARSRAGLRAWQAEHGLPVSGEITRQTLDSMAAAFASIEPPVAVSG